MRLPQYPRSLKDLPNFCRDTIAALRSVQITSIQGGELIQGTSGTAINIKKEPKAPPSSGYIHPWKVTSNGDNTINVAAGFISYYEPDLASGTGDIWTPLTYLAAGYAGSGDTPITVTDSGSVYAIMPITNQRGGDVTSNTLSELTFLIPNGSITIDASNPTPTGSNIYLLLATVDLTAGVVTVTTQHLDHNPSLQVQQTLNHS